jgi:DNA polymerase III delta subunit
MNLSLIIEESPSVVRDELTTLTRKLGYVSEQIKEMYEWDSGSQYLSTSLFGDRYFIFLDLTNKDNMKSFVKQIEANPNKFKGSWFGDGLFIAVSTAQGAKKIEDLVTKSGGKIRKKMKPETVRDEMLKKVEIQPTIKDALRDFVGDDYEMLISFVNDTKKLTKEEQLKLSLEQVLIALPQKPGAIKPWNFLTPMLIGDITNSISTYERTVVNTHILVLMLFARQRLELMYRVKLAQDEGLWKSSEIASSLGIKDGPSLWEITKAAKRLSVQTCEWLAKYTITTENSLKGGKNIDPKAQFQVFLSAVCLAIKYNRPLAV